MVDLSSLGSDIVAGATALGGLQLVFLGNVVSSFNSFSAEAQDTVRFQHTTKALKCLLGVVACLLSTIIALIGKWADLPYLIYAAILILIIALFLGCYLAYVTYKEVE